MQQSTQQSANPADDAKKCIRRIRSRLERWELPHLRELAAELQQRLEYAERCAIDAERRADMFMDLNHEMQDELSRCGKGLGITQDGKLLLVPIRSICDDFGNLVEVTA